MKIIFFISLFLILIPFFFYPLIIFLLNIVFPRKIKDDKIKMKKISFLIPAYNEEKVIGQKIENIKKVSAHYPFEMIVVSDGSTDGTEEIAKLKGAKVLRIDRGGKIKALKRGLKESEGDIIAITDADTELPENIILKCMEYMEYKKAGCVGCGYRFKGEKSGRNIFKRIEDIIRTLEGKLGITLSYDGTFFMAKKELFEDFENLPDEIQEDFYIPLKSLSKGFKNFYLKDIYVYNLQKTKDEFRRRIRIFTRAFFTLSVAPKLNLTLKIALFCHKILRYFLIIPLILLYISSFWLNKFIFIFFTLIFIYSLTPLPFSNSLRIYLSSLIASIPAFFNFLKGKKFKYWNV